MESIVRLMPEVDRLGRECYFCGDKRSVKYMVSNAIDISGQLVEKEVPCCTKCLAFHVYDPRYTQ